MAQANSDHNILDSDPLGLKILNRWMALSPKEKRQFIHRIRADNPSDPELADAFERHYRSLQARGLNT